MIASTIQRSLSESTEYFPLSVEALRPDEIVEFDIYIQASPSTPPVLYRERHLVMTEDALARLRETKVRTVLVPQAQRVSLRAYIDEKLGSVLADPSVPVDEKSSMLYFSAKETIREVLSNPFAGETLSRSRTVVGHTMDFLFREAKAFSSLLRITSYDYYTYTHSERDGVRRGACAGNRAGGRERIPAVWRGGVAA